MMGYDSVIYFYHQTKEEPSHEVREDLSSAGKNYQWEQQKVEGIGKETQMK